MRISGPVYSSHQDLPYYPGTSLRIYVLVPFRGACALLCTHEDDHTSVRMYSVWLCAWDDVCPQITETIVDEEHRGADQCVAEWTTLDKEWTTYVPGWSMFFLADCVGQRVA